MAAQKCCSYFVLTEKCGMSREGGSFDVQTGPRLSWGQITRSRACNSAEACAVFKDRHPSTMAVTVLVVVEMFNALNALSENNSLLQVRAALCLQSIVRMCLACFWHASCKWRHGGRCPTQSHRWLCTAVRSSSSPPAVCLLT